MRSVVVFAFLAGCAGSGQPSPYDFGGPHGELSLDYDIGEGPNDLAAKNHDLSHVDFAGVDLSGADFETPGCGIAQIVVNEVQTGSVASALDEFVELYNPCPTSVSLAGATLKYRSATNSTANDTCTIANLTGMIGTGTTAWYLVASANYSGGGTPDQPKGWAGCSGLAATGGAVGLRDSGGGLIDSVGWGSANNPFVETATATNPAAGHSTARTPNGTDTNNNSTDFAEATTPTPRAQN
jgi:hypothetical protein